MSILQKIDDDLKEALKGGDKAKLSVLRGLKSDMKYKQIAIGKELSPEQITEVLSSARKKRQESIEQFRLGGRQDLVDKEEFELLVVSSYLPKQLSEDDLRSLVRAAIEETGADSPQKIGLVMKALMPKVKGRADGKLVNRLAAEMLAN